MSILIHIESRILIEIIMLIMNNQCKNLSQPVAFYEWLLNKENLFHHYAMIFEGIEHNYDFELN